MAYIGWFGEYLIAALCVLPPLLLLFSLPSMSRVRLNISAPPQVSRGCGATLNINFSTKAILPLSRVRVFLKIENSYDGELTKSKYTYSNVLTSSGKVSLPTELCGVFTCTVTHYECRDMLGLISIRRKCGASTRCTVLPNPVQPDKHPNIDACMDTTVNLRPKYGGGYSEEHELREYRPGDTVNTIHWKLSSKTDDIIVREALEPENDQIFLILSKTGKQDRGLESLYWLSLQLCSRETPHIIVSGNMYSVENEDESAAALSAILSSPLTEPCRIDRSHARCIFTVSAGEVEV